MESHLKHFKLVKLNDLHPNLLNELNDPDSPIPAYVRF
jgi:hypothetical protein